MHQALYRKWRPATFDEVCGQEHITSILKYEISNSKFSHAYLFCGSRGTGKTTCAKILSRAVNCLSPVDGSPCGKCEACRMIESGATTDVLEMDAASNNGVDNVRDIRDEVVYAPSSLKYRVYIIDEVHMLSSSAFNALLKTLEEPPAHVVFILATTELHKLPATIISRCQRFDFRRIATDVLKDRLMHIASSEGIDLCEDAAVLIAKHAQGGMRDAISLLELSAGNRERITAELVNSTIGSSGRGEMLRVCEAVADRDYEVIFSAINEVVTSSRDISVFWEELISVYRDLLIIKTSRNASVYLDLTDSETEVMNALARKFSREQLSYHCQLLEEALVNMLKANSVRRIIAELTLIKMCDARLSSTPEALLARIEALESRPVTTIATPADVTAIQSASDSTQSAKKHLPKKEDDEDFRSDAPISVSVEQKASVTNAEKVIRPFKRRAEVVEKLMDVNPMVAPFYKGAKWYTDGSGKMILKFSDPFSADCTRTWDKNGDFLRVISEVTGHVYKQSDVIYEIEGNRSEYTVIDEILDNANN